MSIEIKISCPLGSECEVPKEGYVERCAWYTKLVGKNPQSKKDIDEWACAMAWMPIMMVENSQMVRSNRVVMESIRDESKEFNSIVSKATKKIT